MKKVIVLASAVTMILAFIACGSRTPEQIISENDFNMMKRGTFHIQHFPGGDSFVKDGMFAAIGESEGRVIRINDKLYYGTDEVGAVDKVKNDHKIYEKARKTGIIRDIKTAKAGISHDDRTAAHSNENVHTGNRRHGATGAFAEKDRQSD